MDGFDPSGLIILQKERSWIEQGLKVGEHVIPLARNFNGTDVETGSSNMDRTLVEMKATSSLSAEGANGTPSKSSKEDRRYSSSKEAISNKYAAIREQSRQASFNTNPVEKNISAAKVSLLDGDNSNPDNTSGGSPTGLSSKWESMKNGFQNFKANIAAKKFIPIRQVQDTIDLSRASSNESLDEIFQRLKRPSVDHVSYVDEDEDDREGKSGPSR